MRLLYGARIALAIGLIADGIAGVIGTTLGLISGYYSGKVDSWIMRFMDIMLAFPYLLLAMIVVAVLGQACQRDDRDRCCCIPQFARLVRGTVLTVREQDYVDAATVIGNSAPRIMLRHVLPNAVMPIIVMATLDYWLCHSGGFRTVVPWFGCSAAYGRMGSDAIRAGGDYMLSDIWLATIPGLAILITVLGFNLLGDGPRARSTRAFGGAS